MFEIPMIRGRAAVPDLAAVCGPVWAAQVMLANTRSKTGLRMNQNPPKCVSNAYRAYPGGGSKSTLRISARPDTMTPRMNRRKKTRSASPNLLRFLIGLWMLASLGYWIAGVMDEWQERVHVDRLVRQPFAYNPDTRRIDQVESEAATAGVTVNDTLQQLNGANYSGMAQWLAVLHESHPGDILEVGYARPDGSLGSATLSLARSNFAAYRATGMLFFWEEFLVVGLLPLICLLIGYWVVLSRPTDRNAWLSLVLLTYPSVVFMGVGLSTDFALVLRNIWYQFIQIAVCPALLLFGVYFPERSRID